MSHFVVSDLQSCCDRLVVDRTLPTIYIFVSSLVTLVLNGSPNVPKERGCSADFIL